jgi:hypothetical protein
MRAAENFNSLCVLVSVVKIGDVQVVGVIFHFIDDGPLPFSTGEKVINGRF